MRVIEAGGIIGSSLAAATLAPEFIYYASGGQVDIRGTLPLRLLFAAGGGIAGAVAGHIAVSFLNRVINAPQVNKSEGDGSESVSSEVWRLLKLPTPLNKPEVDVSDGSELVDPEVWRSLRLPPGYKPDDLDE